MSTIKIASNNLKPNRRAADLISEYCERCRDQVAPLLEKHYSFRKVWQLQKQHIVYDLWRLPLNCLLAIPYMSLKKTFESLDKLGWSQPLHIIEPWPPGFKTSLQNYFEHKISSEIFKVDTSQVQTTIVRKMLKKYALGQTIVSNFSASISIFVIGWLLLDQSSLGFFGLISHLIDYFALDRSASNFIFGDGLGRAFYGVFSPEISWVDILASLLVVYIFLTIAGFGMTLIYYPLRKHLGFEEKKLHKMINEIEQHLIFESHKSVGSYLDDF